MRDAATVVAQNQDVTGAQIGNTLSQFSYDTGVAGTPPDAFQAVGSIIADFGRGSPIFPELRVTTAFAGAGATIKGQVVMADTADLVTGLTMLEETDAIAVALLVAGYRFRLGSVPGGITKRYLGFQLVVAVAALTAGQFWGEFTLSKIDRPVTS